MSKVVESTTAQTEWLDLPGGGGGKYRRDPKNWKRGQYYCPDCNKPHDVKSIPSDGSESLRQRTGRCEECAHKRTRKYPESFPHRSGAMCFLYDPDPSRPDTHARFICADYDPATHSAKPTYAKLASLYDPRWKGRCPDCVHKLRTQERSKADITLYRWSHSPDGPDGPPVAKLLYSQEAPEGKVYVYYYQCRHTVLLTRGSVHATLSAHRTRRQHCASRCRSCFYDPTALLSNIAADNQNGNGQKNSGAVKVPKTRRKRESLKTVNGKSLEDLDACILKHYAEKRVNSDVTLELVAGDMGLGRAGIGDGGQKNVSRLLKRNEVADTFPKYRDKLIVARGATVMPYM